jgi:putative transposon-encoded protein
METMGAVAGILLFIKIGLHLYLLSKIENDFRILDYSSPASFKRTMVLLPSMEDVPKNYLGLKIIINILYAIAVFGIIVFLIWFNTFNKNG